MVSQPHLKYVQHACLTLGRRTSKVNLHSHHGATSGGGEWMDPPWVFLVFPYFEKAITLADSL